jgi:hypothetical protein
VIGGVPQATHKIALSETSFPQFLQYMILILVLSTHLAFRSRPVFVVVTGLHFINDSFKDIYFVQHNISLRIKKGKVRTGSLKIGFSSRNKLSLQSGAVHK